MTMAEFRALPDEEKAQHVHALEVEYTGRQYGPVPTLAECRELVALDRITDELRVIGGGLSVVEQDGPKRTGMMMAIGRRLAELRVRLNANGRPL